MPPGINLTQDILGIRPKSIIYIKSEGTGLIHNKDCFQAGNDYIEVFGWNGPTSKFVKYIGTAEEKKFSEQKTANHIRIQIRKDFKKDIQDMYNQLSKIKIFDEQKYQWETDLKELTGPVETIKLYKK
jgi:hypothetical protein